MKTIVMALAAAALLIGTTPVEARTHRHNLSCYSNGFCQYASHREVRTIRKKRKRIARDANGNRATMVTVKTAYGFDITVHPYYASKFLKFFSLLKEHGHEVNPKIVGCWAGRGHVRGSNHYIGAACDNQTGWNRAPSYMYKVGDLIRQAGLFDGCSFGDCGHVEAVRGTHNKPPNLYAALEKFKSDQSTANYQP